MNKNMPFKGLLRLYISECLLDMFDTFADTNPTDEQYNRYNKHERILRLYLECAELGLEEFSWKALADEGALCQKDWEWFPEQIKEAGLGTYKEYSTAYFEKNKNK